MQLVKFTWFAVSAGGTVFAIFAWNEMSLVVRALTVAILVATFAAMLPDAIIGIRRTAEMLPTISWPRIVIPNFPTLPNIFVKFANGFRDGMAAEPYQHALHIAMYGNMLTPFVVIASIIGGLFIGAIGESIEGIGQGLLITTGAMVLLFAGLCFMMFFIEPGRPMYR